MPKKKNKLRLAWRVTGTVGDNVRAVLPALTEDFFDSGRNLLSREFTYEELHSFRLKGKNFRYTLELFRPCFGPGLNERIDRLKNLQNFLGDINDCAATSEILVSALPTDHEMLAYLDKRAGRKLEEFKNHWRVVFDAPGQLDDWMRYLSRYGPK